MRDNNKNKMNQSTGGNNQKKQKQDVEQPVESCGGDMNEENQSCSESCEQCCE